MKKFKMLILSLFMLPAIFLFGCSAPEDPTTNANITLDSLYNSLVEYSGTYKEFVDIACVSDSDISSIKLYESSDDLNTYKIFYKDNASNYISLSKKKDNTKIVAISKQKTIKDGKDATNYSVLYADGEKYRFIVNDGTDGIGIQSIDKTNSSNGVDTYTITLSNYSTYSFTVTNGKDGVGISYIVKSFSNGNVDTYTITYSNGTTTTFNVTNGTNIKDAELNVNNELILTLTDNSTINVGYIKGGKDGIDGRGIISISKTNTNGLEDVYTVRYTDNTYTTFTIRNGRDGRGIDQIVKSSNGLTDTYTIHYTDYTSYTFTVTNGSNGNSAYEIYKAYNPTYTKSENDWIIDLVNGELTTNRYTVTFNSNGGSSVASQTNIKYGGKATKPSDPTRSGYTFEGWFLGDEKWSFAGYSVTENITLTAHWKQNGFTVSFNTNGHGNYPSQKLAIGDQLILPTPVLYGYTYEWQVNGQVITNGPWNISHDTTINLITTPIVYTIDYNLDGGQNHHSNPSTYTVESEVIYLKSATKNGYVFAGWYDNNMFTGKRYSHIERLSTGNIVLYAKWNTSYTINLDTNGGQVNNDKIYISLGDSYSLPIPTRAGYNFLGWFNNGTQYTEGIWDRTSDLSLVASWQIINYTITYNLNGATNNPQNIHTYNVESGTIYLFEPTKTNYTFSHWSEYYYGYDYRIDRILSTTCRNITLYANFEEDIYDESTVLITSASQLRATTFEQEKTYRLVNDIDLQNNEWTPKSLQYATFDGWGHTIYNLKITTTNEDYVDDSSGLFAVVNNSTIKNLSIVNTTIDVTVTSPNSVGTIAGRANNSTFESCHTNGIIDIYLRNWTVDVGGLIGYATENTVITNCSNSANISVQGVSGADHIYAGGLIGQYECELTINSSYSTGNITANTYDGEVFAGGLVGRNYNYYDSILSISNCYATGNISGTASDDCVLGGLIGEIYRSDDNSHILNCYATGNITGRQSTTPYLDDFDDEIIGPAPEEGEVLSEEEPNPEDDFNLYNASIYAGGLIGRVHDGNQISNCYATGNVLAYYFTNRYQIGGLVGYTENENNIVNSHRESSQIVHAYCDCDGEINSLGISSPMYYIINAMRSIYDPIIWTFNNDNTHPTLKNAQHIMYSNINMTHDKNENFYYGNNFTQLTLTNSKQNVSTNIITSISSTDINTIGTLLRAYIVISVLDSDVNALLIEENLRAQINSNIIEMTPYVNDGWVLYENSYYYCSKNPLWTDGDPAHYTLKAIPSTSIDTYITFLTNSIRMPMEYCNEDTQIVIGINFQAVQDNILTELNLMSGENSVENIHEAFNFIGW